MGNKLVDIVLLVPAVLVVDEIVAVVLVPVLAVALVAAAVVECRSSWVVEAVVQNAWQLQHWHH